MKKLLLLGTAMSLAMVATASAADLPRPGPAPVYVKGPPPVWTWTGCYIGGNVGGGWSHNDASDAVSGSSFVTVNGSGLVGGGQVGCDYQFGGPWVVGVAGEFEGGSIKGTTTVPANAALLIPANTVFADTRIPWIATVTARLGYALTPATLLYARGGGAFSRDNITISQFGPPVAVVATGTDNRSGWTVGGGIEQKFMPYLSGFVEYNYIGLGTKTVAITAVSGSGFTGGNASIKENIQEVLVGLNFRFGGF